MATEQFGGIVSGTAVGDRPGEMLKSTIRVAGELANDKFLPRGVAVATALGVSARWASFSRFPDWTTEVAVSVPQGPNVKAAKSFPPRSKTRPSRIAARL